MNIRVLKYFPLLVITTLISCKSNPKDTSTYFGGKIINPKSNHVVLYSMEEVIDTFHLNENDKFSTDYFDCTWVVCSWVSKETWKNISFLSHQDSLKILEWSKQSFEEGIIERLRYMNERTYTDTFSVWLFWWSVDSVEMKFSNYFEIVKMIRILVSKTLNRKLDVLIWPNKPTLSIWTDEEDMAGHFHYDTTYWVLYSSKPEQLEIKYNKWFDSHDLYDFLK